MQDNEAIWRSGAQASDIDLSFFPVRFLASLLVTEQVEIRHIRRDRMMVGICGERHDDGKQVSCGQWFNALIEPCRWNRSHR